MSAADANARFEHAPVGRDRSRALPAPPKCAAACFLGGIFLAAGCAGYQVGVDSLYRRDIRTVHVPVFESNSYRRGLGERLTEAVVKEIEDRTPYKVVSAAEADTVLQGRIGSETKNALTEDRFDVPRDLEIDLEVQVQWVDRRGTLMMQPLSVSVRQPANFIPEAGQSIATAQQEAIVKLARQIVDQMELVW